MVRRYVEVRIKKPAKLKTIRLSVSISTDLDKEYAECLSKIGAKKGPYAAILISDFVAAQRRAS